LAVFRIYYELALWFTPQMSFSLRGFGSSCETNLPLSHQFNTSKLIQYNRFEYTILYETKRRIRNYQKVSFLKFINSWKLAL